MTKKRMGLNLTGKQYVPGNIKDFLQLYQIYYYKPIPGFPTDKIWIFIDGEEKGEPRMIRSLCFKNPTNHKKFITNNIYAHIYQLIKRAENNIPNTLELISYKKRLLDDLLIEIKKEILEKWRKSS
jgi:hypothetical protein